MRSMSHNFVQTQVGVNLSQHWRTRKYSKRVYFLSIFAKLVAFVAVSSEAYFWIWLSAVLRGRFLRSRLLFLFGSSLSGYLYLDVD